MVRSLVAAGIFAVALAGCSGSKLGNESAFGGTDLTITGSIDTSGYTAPSALSEARRHFRSNDFGYAAAFYKRAVELAPKNAEAYVGLGASYDRLGRFDLADRVYEKLYALTGGTAQYYNNVGFSYLLRGNLGAAQTNLRKAKNLDPSSEVIANNLLILANAAAAARA